MGHHTGFASEPAKRNHILKIYFYREKYMKILKTTAYHANGASLRINSKHGFSKYAFFLLCEKLSSSINSFQSYKGIFLRCKLRCSHRNSIKSNTNHINSIILHIINKVMHDKTYI